MLCLHDVDPLNICMKKYDCQKIIFDKTTAMRTWAIFLSFFLQVRESRGRSTPILQFLMEQLGIMPM